MGASLRICLTGILLILQIYLSAQEKPEIYIRQSIPDSIIKDGDVVSCLIEIEAEGKSPVNKIKFYRNFDQYSGRFPALSVDLIS